MKDKILHILSICLTAKTMGHNVFFDYAPHVKLIRIHSYSDNYNFEQDETPDVLFTFEFYMDGDVREIYQTIENMETAIQKLIDGEFE